MIPALDVLPAMGWEVLAIFWGAIWGSFGNVVIFRMPEGLSIVKPASHCPGCKTPINWYDNVPVLSWIVLRGKCRKCHTKISVQYPLVELASAVLAAMAMHGVLTSEVEGLPLVLATFMVHFAFLWALLVLSVIDLRTMLLPDAITLPGIVLGLTFILIVDRTQALAHGLAVIGSYLTVWIFFVLGYKLLARREGMGMGDAKLLAMIGALLGWKGAVFALVAGATQGLLINLPLLLKRRAQEALASEGDDEALSKAGDSPPVSRGDEDESVLRSEIPFGPMLSLAAFEYFFWGEQLIEWYFSLIDGLVGSFIL